MSDNYDPTPSEEDTDAHLLLHTASAVVGGFPTLVLISDLVDVMNAICNARPEVAAEAVTEEA